MGRSVRSYKGFAIGRSGADPVIFKTTFLWPVLFLSQYDIQQEASGRGYERRSHQHHTAQQRHTTTDTSSISCTT